ncbi:NAD(P)-dependent oxidoreductase [Kutzneria kofuensis]|uniref:Phosphoglycerate dehydrogenase-like enzyme n=1 Tax=Kutzneria kofuensis TaxID=103725 RepID=A0A7W9KF56_9PSEU|nr:NAD(P)-dependent oxidoreductase [Kutzneria kofuensis]MBB5891479.1 phosphoglycerate dehydrogenase-like enzyme [Kutzneria kofuensis]
MRLLIGFDEYPLDPFNELLPGWDIERTTPERFPELAVDADVVCPIAATVDSDLLKAGRFGLVQQFGVGLEKVDVDAATAAGVWVSRLPGDVTGNADSVAELAVLLTLALGRRLDEARQALRNRVWAQPVGRALFDGTAVIVGLGSIGLAVAKRLSGFGMRLVAVRARPELGGPPEIERVVGVDRLPEVLGRADVVISSLMFGEHNRNFFDANAFAAMKPGALFVNVARGGLVDEAALLAALESGHIGGAGLDVHVVEPADPGSPLVNHPKVIATPHVAGVTEQMMQRSVIAFTDNLKRYAAGQPLQWTVNEPSQVAQRRPQG